MIFIHCLIKLLSLGELIWLSWPLKIMGNQYGIYNFLTLKKYYFNEL
jgi:hypothetical protein